MLAPMAATFQTERLNEALWSELQPLLAQHWHEVAHYDDLMLNPDRAAYERIDKAGGMRIYTARGANGSLIGYLAMFVSVSMHYMPERMANQDVLYVDPMCRGSRVGVDLIAYAHDKLQAEGVTVVFQHVKARKDLNIGPMLKRLLGYELVDEIWAVRLDKEW